jgi:histidinol phosphatase-like PHP family hydrolase
MLPVVLLGCSSLGKVIKVTVIKNILNFIVSVIIAIITLIKEFKILIEINGPDGHFDHLRDCVALHALHA